MLCRRQTGRLMLSVSHCQTEHLHLLLSSMCARAYLLSADETLLLHSFFINSHRVTVFQHMLRLLHFPLPHGIYAKFTYQESYSALFKTITL